MDKKTQKKGNNNGVRVDISSVNTDFFYLYLMKRILKSATCLMLVHAVDLHSTNKNEF